MNRSISSLYVRNTSSMNLNIMNKKHIVSGIVIVTAGITPVRAQVSKESMKPNVIFILADDLGWMDLGCYGSSFYETPNIDQLAKEGISFTNAYAACPVSSPTRASFQTGKYPARLHLTDYIPGGYSIASRKKIIDSICPVLPVAFENNMPLSELTIAEALKLEGYQTAHIGKWNCSIDSLTYPQYQGYDINIAGCNKGAPGKGGYFSPYHNPYLSDGPVGEYLTDRLGNECINIIRRFKDDPFFINLPFYQVHTPLLAKPDKIKYFEEKAKKMGLKSTLEVYEKNPEWKKKQPYQDSTRIERIIQNNAVYAAMISSMDENIGRIINELKKLGLYENTIIIFTSDNGGLATSEGSPTTNRPLRGGKGFTYEGGIREPLIIRMPNIEKPGILCDSIVISTDYYPTILEMVNGKMHPEQHVDGISILPLLKGKNCISRDAIYWHYPHYSNQGGRPSGAIRMGNYKLLQFYDTGELELYDLSTDLSEQKNLRYEKPELTQELLKKLNDWRKSVNAVMPIKNPRIHD